MCSKSSYQSTDTRSGGSGCLLWFGDLMDMKVMHEVGEDIYIRMPSSESEEFVGLALEEAYPESQQNLCAALTFLSLIRMMMYNAISIDGYPFQGVELVT
ncbi:hypothetical protein ACH5RR_035129 [Cinchona calisaya]|uniref:Apple domain-containing protein n=1 Tax=Cinchona calisaya TaxID=153742 RepID=A0ABD2YCX6_9GENT